MKRAEPEISWNEGSHLDPGTYRAYVRFAKQYWVRLYKRWTCLLKFDVMDAGFNVLARNVPLWWNLGADEDQPHAGRGSKYFVAWVTANGAPKRKDRMSPTVFVDRFVQVQIGYSDGPAPYSVVKEILSWETGESRINQSINQPIKEARGLQPQNESLTENAWQKENAPSLNDASDSLVSVSALGGVESGQPNPTQGRVTEDRRPQSQYTAVMQLHRFCNPFAESERRALLRQQVETVRKSRGRG